MDLLYNGQVAFNNGQPHGTWRDIHGDLLISFHHTGVHSMAIEHLFKRIPRTNAWELHTRSNTTIDSAWKTLLLAQLPETAD